MPRLMISNQTAQAGFVVNSDSSCANQKIPNIAELSNNDDPCLKLITASMIEHQANGA